MPQSRSDAVTALLDELDAVEVNYSEYHGDLEPQWATDAFLNGKLASLLSFCQVLGWSELVPRVQPMIPVNGNATQVLSVLKSFVIPEARLLIDSSDIDAPANPHQWFWEFIHPRICALARPRFESGFYADAVEASFKEVNDSVKRIVRETSSRELDGAGLMTTAFSLQAPLIRLTNLVTDSDRNIQQGYMQIMAGAMTGIRNPKAHGNLAPSSSRALHLICLASLLMHKVDERVECEPPEASAE